MRNCLICLVDALRYDVVTNSTSETLLRKLGVADGLDTPNMNHLSEKGTLIPSVHSTYGSTPPAVASLMTGLYPREHHCYDYFQPMKQDVRTLPDYFSEAGYHTLIVNGHPFFEEMGLNDRFDEQILGPAKHLVNRIKELNQSGTPVFAYYHTFDVHQPYCLSSLPPVEEYHDTAIGFANDIAQRLNKDVTFTRDDSFVRTDDPHAPYQAGGTGGEVLPLWNFINEHVHEPQEDSESIFEDPLSVLAQLYVEGVNLFDRYQLGPIIDFLDSDSEGMETTFLLTSDHGETIKRTDQGSQYMDHHGKPTEELIRVPAILYNRDAQNKTDYDESVPRSLVDVVPTLLDEFDLDEHVSTSGRSWFNESSEERQIFAEASRTIREATDSENPEKDNIFPLPAILEWSCMLNEDGYKYYRRGLDLEEKDYERPIDDFLRTVFERKMNSWVTDEALESYREDFEDPESRSERDQFVQMVETMQEELPGTTDEELYNWHEDNFETENLLSENIIDREQLDEWKRVLQNRFDEPLSLDNRNDHTQREDNEELVNSLEGLGYI